MGENIELHKDSVLAAPRARYPVREGFHLVAIMRLVIGATAVAAVIIYVSFRRRKLVHAADEHSTPVEAVNEQSTGGPAVSMRPAVESDLPHLSALSQASGQNIIPGGGDFVSEAWVHAWWKMDARLHFNEFAFVDQVPEKAVGFVRVECYGSPEVAESGWLEGLRVHPDYQGLGIMNRLQSRILSRIPTAVRANLFLAVGSDNERMRSICNSKYEYLGAFTAHKVISGAPPASRARYDVHKMSVAPLTADGAAEAWAFLLAHPLHASGRLVLPGLFYGFRAATKRALDDKVASAGAFAVRSASGTILGLFFAFDTDIHFGGTPVRYHTFVAAADASTGDCGAALTAFEKAAQPLARGVQLVVTAGPWLNDGAPGGDVEPRMAKALAAANWTRTRGTHLRVYRVPE